MPLTSWFVVFAMKHSLEIIIKTIREILIFLA